MTYSDEFREVAVRKAAQTTDVEAAEAFGVPRRTIIRWRQAAGVASGYEPPERTARHGSPAMYQHRGCRCETCVTAHNRRQTQMRRYRTMKLQQDPSLAPHGSPSTYTNWGCRCDECRAAWRVEMRRQAARRRVKRAEEAV